MYRFLLLICALPAELLAQQASSDIAVVEPLSTSYLMKLTGGLILVVAAIFCLAWLLKRLKLTQHSQHGLLKIVAGLPLGTRDRIIVLQVGEEQLLLGLSPGRIENLHTLTTPLVDQADEHAMTPFAEKLQGLLNRDGTK